MSRCDACLYSIGHDEGCPRSAYTEPSADYARGRADALREAVALLRKCSEGQTQDTFMLGVEWSIEKLENMR